MFTVAGGGTDASEVSALIVVHDEGVGLAALKALSRRYTGGVRVAVSGPDVVAREAELEHFMADVRPARFNLVHVIPGGADVAVTHDTQSVTDVAEVDALLRQRFPALADVEASVALDVGRAWDASARDLVAGVTDIAAQARVRRVFAVSGSTDLTVAPSLDDRMGMLADVAWNLAVSNLGVAPGLDRAWVWAVGSQSFTFDGVAWYLVGSSGSIAEAINNGPRAPLGEGLRDTDRQQGSAWVAECQIGTEEERGRLAAAGSGDAMEQLTVDRASIATVAPVDWSLAVEREHMRVAGPPLAAYKRIVSGAAQELLRGRPGDPSTGLVSRFDTALTGRLHDQSGCLRAGRFVQGAAEGLAGASQHVADVPHVDPASIDLDKARADLDRAVARLPQVRPWAVRGGLLSLAALTLVVGTGVAAAVAVPAAAGLLAGAWGLMRRRRAVRLRDRYIHQVEAKIRAVAFEHVLAAQLGMVKDLRSHIGSYFDEGGDPTEMETSVAPPLNTRAEDVKRIWECLGRLADEFGDPKQAVAVWEPLPAIGKFFHTFPRDVTQVASVRQHESEKILQMRTDVVAAVTEQLQALRLDDSDEEIRHRLVTAAEAQVEDPLTIDDLADVDSTAANAAAGELARRNAPRLDVQLVLQGAKVVVSPTDAVPRRFESIGHADMAQEPLLTCTSADDRREAVLWLRPQDFPQPEWKPLEPEDPSSPITEDGAGGSKSNAASSATPRPGIGLEPDGGA